MRMRHLLFAAVLGVSALPAQACRMTMALEQWPPYLYRDAQGSYTGLDLELLQAIFKEAHCTLVTLPELPTARRQLLFQTGGLDLMLAASETPERQSYARFSISYRDEAVGVFGKAGTPAAQRHVGSFGQLARGKATLLAPKVGWYGAQYAAARPALEKDGRLNTFGSFRQGIVMFDAGRADPARLGATARSPASRSSRAARPPCWHPRSAGMVPIMRRPVRHWKKTAA